MATDLIDAALYDSDIELDLRSRDMFLFDTGGQRAFHVYGQNGSPFALRRAFIIRRGSRFCHELDDATTVLPSKDTAKWSGGWLCMPVDLPNVPKLAILKLRLSAERLEQESKLLTPADVPTRVRNFASFYAHALRRKVRAFMAA